MMITNLNMASNASGVGLFIILENKMEDELSRWINGIIDPKHSKRYRNEKVVRRKKRIKDMPKEEIDSFWEKVK